MVKISEVQHKKIILKDVREKQPVTYKSKSIIIIADIST